MSLPLRVKVTTAGLRGLAGSIRTTPVPTRAKTGIATFAPAFCLKVIVEVKISGRTSLAARPVVLPASAGINATNLAQRGCAWPG